MTEGSKEFYAVDQDMQRLWGKSEPFGGQGFDKDGRFGYGKT